MRRRSFLSAVAGCGAVGIAGCASIGGSSGEVRPERTPRSVPAEFVCEADSFDRHPSGYSEDALRWGDAAGFSLRVDEVAFEYGETAEIRLEGDGERGNRHKFNVELYTETGWTEVRGTTEDAVLMYTDEAVSGGFTTEVELTEAGIVEASHHDDVLDVCPDLVPGRYRFVFWGLIGDPVVAVAFDLASAGNSKTTR
jgi:hypothetical protein